MQKTLLLPLGLCLVLGAAPVRDDDQAEARAVLDKAIKAAGGQARLAKFPAVTMKVKGVFHEDGEKSAYTGDWSMQGYDQSRTVTVTEDGGAKTTEVRVVNRTKGWVKTDDGDAEDMDADALVEENEALYLSQVTMLAPVKGKAFNLASLGASKMGDRTAAGIRVAHDGHRDISLFFDSRTWMLLKTERRVKDLENDKDLTEEIFFEDYKEVQSTRQAMKITWKRDGKLFSEAVVTELKLLEKLPDSLFAKP